LDQFSIAYRPRCIEKTVEGDKYCKQNVEFDKYCKRNSRRQQILSNKTVEGDKYWRSKENSRVEFDKYCQVKTVKGKNSVKKKIRLLRAYVPSTVLYIFTKIGEEPVSLG